MACACKGRKKFRYVWTSEDGQTRMVYDQEVVAKAKVKRKGGSYLVEPAP